MSDLAEHELDVQHAAAVGAALLNDSPDHVEFSHVADETTRIRIKPRPGELWKIQLAMGVVAAGSFAMSYASKNLLADDFDPQPFSSFFFYIAFAVAGIAILLLLVQVTAGPARDTIIELSPGVLKLDHYIAGDHINRTYSAADVRGVMMVQEVTLVVPHGEYHIAHSATPDIRAALVAVIAMKLWQDRARLLANVRRRGFPAIPLCAFDGTVDASGVNADPGHPTK